MVRNSGFKLESQDFFDMWPMKYPGSLWLSFSRCNHSFFISNYFYNDKVTEKKEKWKVLITQSRPTLYNTMDYSLPSSSVHGILQARILEWVAISFSREYSWPREWTQVSCIAGRFFTVWATREARKKEGCF